MPISLHAAGLSSTLNPHAGLVNRGRFRARMKVNLGRFESIRGKVGRFGHSGRSERRLARSIQSHAPRARNPQKLQILSLPPTLDLLSLYGRPSMRLACRNPKQMKILDVLSFYGGPSLLPAGRNPQKFKMLNFVKPLWPTVVASGGPKS